MIRNTSETKLVKYRVVCTVKQSDLKGIDGNLTIFSSCNNSRDVSLFWSLETAFPLLFKELIETSFLKLRMIF